MMGSRRHVGPTVLSCTGVDVVMARRVVELARRMLMVMQMLGRAIVRRARLHRRMAASAPHRRLVQRLRTHVYTQPHHRHGVYKRKNTPEGLCAGFAVYKVTDVIYSGGLRRFEVWRKVGPEYTIVDGD